MACTGCQQTFGFYFQGFYGHRKAFPFAFSEIDKIFKDKIVALYAKTTKNPRTDV